MGGKVAIKMVGGTHQIHFLLFITQLSVFPLMPLAMLVKN